MDMENATLEEKLSVGLSSMSDNKDMATERAEIEAKKRAERVDKVHVRKAMKLISETEHMYGS